MFPFHDVITNWPFVCVVCVCVCVCVGGGGGGGGVTGAYFHLRAQVSFDSEFEVSFFVKLNEVFEQTVEFLVTRDTM